MSELKPCPFCGALLVANNSMEDFYVRRYGTYYVHPSALCFLDGTEISPSEVEDWNRRAPASEGEQK